MPWEPYCNVELFLASNPLLCGNGVVDPGEDCDGGNGCSAECESLPCPPPGISAIGIDPIAGRSCPPGGGALGEPTEWLDEQGDQFQLSCPAPGTFNLTYTGCSNLTGHCPWCSGRNGAVIVSGGDRNNMGEYPCFLSSFWRSREALPNEECRPGILCRDVIRQYADYCDADPFTGDQGVGGQVDWWEYDLDAQRRHLVVKYWVSLDGPGGPEKDKERVADRIVEDCLGSVGGQTSQGSSEALAGFPFDMIEEPFAPCDQDWDHDCDAEDFSVLANALGRCLSDDGFNSLADHDHDGCVTLGDIRAAFPDIDLDADGVPNVTDNCVVDSNPGQIDEDNDGFGDACDCAPNDGSAFEVPREIQDVVVTRTEVLWHADAPNSGAGAIYDVVRGSLSELPVGAGPSEVCLQSFDTISQDLQVPESGNGFYYIVRSHNACGVGTYGSWSDGTERMTPQCSCLPGCDDTNACTRDSCSTGMCIHTPIRCNDNNACTADTCDLALGCVHTNRVCVDFNECTADSCHPSTGCGYSPLDGAACDDGDPCSTADTCLGGVCQGGGPPPDCDDGHLCTADFCEPWVGCSYTFICDDGDQCTNDSCDPATGGCTNTAVTCEDGDPCTTDSCDPATGCVHTPVPPPCP